MAPTTQQAALAEKLSGIATQMYQLLLTIEEVQMLNNVVGVDWNKVEFANPKYAGADVANFIGSADWFRKLLRNEDVSGSKGDHLTNVVKMAAILG